MSVQINIYLRPGAGNDVYLRQERFAVPIDVFLFANLGSANDVYLRPHGRLIPAGEYTPPPAFPTQFDFLRFQDGTEKQLCVVAEGDANVGEGIRIHHGGVTYAVYIVDTSDTYASSIRFETAAGIRAVRLKS
jgi:hypothetical protein